MGEIRTKSPVVEKNSLSENGQGGDFDINEAIASKSAIIKNLLEGWTESEVLRFKTAGKMLWDSLKVKTPKIAEQFMPLLLQMAELKLLPSANQQFAYLIAYGEKLELQLGIRGFVELASRAGLTITANIVYENEEFELDLGNNSITHKINFKKNKGEKKDKGDFLLVYAWVVQHGQKVIEFVEKEEIDFIRYNISKAPESPSWKNFYGEMAKKIVIKRLLKRVSISSEMARAIEIDNENYTFERVNFKKNKKPLEIEDSIEEKISKKLGDLGVNPQNMEKSQAKNIKQKLIDLLSVDLKNKDDLYRLYDYISNPEGIMTVQGFINDEIGFSEPVNEDEEVNYDSIS